MTGIVLWNDNTSDLAALGEDVQLEFAYFKYSDVVTESGVYGSMPRWRPLQGVATR